jgi:hypothetical protein
MGQYTELDLGGSQRFARMALCRRYQLLEEHGSQLESVFRWKVTCLPGPRPDWVEASPQEGTSNRSGEPPGLLSARVPFNRHTL